MARLRRKKLILPMAVLAVIVIGLLVAFIVLSRGSMSLDAVRRTLSYMGEEKTDSGMVGEMTFVNHSGSFIEQYGDGLIVASRTGVELLDSTGGETLMVSAPMANPNVTVVGDRAFAYDVGGTNYVVIDGGEATAQREADNEIIAASMNSAGGLAIATKQTSYKATVYVFDADNALVLQQNISSGYVTDVQVTADCSGLIAGMCTYSSEFVSRVVRYPISGGGEGEFTISDELVLAVKCFPGGGICAVTERSAYFIGKDLSDGEQYSFGSAYLKDFTFSPGDKCVLLLKEYETGSSGRLVILSDSGSVVGDGEIDSEVLAISAKGKYVAALCYDKLEIFKDNMHLYGETEDTGAAVDLIMREDGSVLLLSYGSARIYLP